MTTTAETITPFRSKSRISQILADNYHRRSVRGRYGFMSQGFYVTSDRFDDKVVIGWETGTFHYNDAIAPRTLLVNDALDHLAACLTRKGFVVEVERATQSAYTYTDGFITVIGKKAEPKAKPSPVVEEPTVGVDRTLVRIPLSDSTGYAKREIVAAVEQGQVVTYERNVSVASDRQVTPKAVWPNERKAMSVALSNAGWGPLDPQFDDEVQV